MMSTSSPEEPAVSWSRISMPAYNDSSLQQFLQPQQINHALDVPNAASQHHQYFSYDYQIPRIFTQYEFPAQDPGLPQTRETEWNDLPFRFDSERSTSIETCSSRGFVIEEEIELSRDEQLQPISEETSEADADCLSTLPRTKVESPETKQILDATASSLTYESTSFSLPFQPKFKKPRGRPRKHPLIIPDLSAKSPKGRSKTGCYTCRRRKKKCDETKPECDNCQKNGVVCEGFPIPQIWKSPKDKITPIDESASSISHNEVIDMPVSRRESLQLVSLDHNLPGIETLEDLVLLDYYDNELSRVLTTQVASDNSFIYILKPIASRHIGMMHSILSLSSSNINYRSKSGQKLLRQHPETNEAKLNLRGLHHLYEAIKVMGQEMRTALTATDDDKLEARYGQMVCLLAHGLCTGEAASKHSFHLEHFQKLFIENKPARPKVQAFYTEYIDFHILAQELCKWPEPVCQPPTREGKPWTFCSNVHRQSATYPSDISTTSKTTLLLSTTIASYSNTACLLGFQNELFYYISETTTLRNMIRCNMQQHREPLADAYIRRRIPELYSRLHKWEPNHGIIGELYKRMAWIYLFRTTHPPSPSLSIDPTLAYEVNIGLGDLKSIPPHNPNQTVLLMPTFIIGCAAFEPEQREVIRECIATIYEYTHLKNSLRTLEVLERVWEYMDEGRVECWDWQGVARELGIQFLAT